VPILANVRTGPTQVAIALVLERLGGGAVGDPLLLELLRCWTPLQHDDHRGEAGHRVPRRPPRAAPRYQEFQQLEQPLVATLIVTALAVIPTELVGQPLSGRAFCS
jgi:hypothetical protein